MPMLCCVGCPWSSAPKGRLSRHPLFRSCWICSIHWMTYCIDVSVLSSLATICCHDGGVGLVALAAVVKSCWSCCCRSGVRVGLQPMLVLKSWVTALVFAKGCGCGCGSKRTAGCTKPEGTCCVGDFLSSIILPTFLACSSRVPNLVDSCSRSGRFAGATVLADAAWSSEPRPRGSAAPLPFALFVMNDMIRRK